MIIEHFSFPLFWHIMQIDDIVKAKKYATEHLLFSDEMVKIYTTVGVTGSTGAFSGECVYYDHIAIITEVLSSSVKVAHQNGGL